MAAIRADRINELAFDYAPRMRAPRPAAAAIASDAAIARLYHPETRDAGASVLVRSSYAGTMRLNPLALLASAGTMLILVGALATLQMTAAKQRPRPPALVLFDALDTAPPPAPPPPPATTPKAKATEIVTPPIAPKPLIEQPSSAPAYTAPEVPPQPVTIAPAPPAAPAERSAPATPAPSAPAAVREGDLSSRLLAARPPAYPVESRRAHEQGTVQLLVLVGTDGLVQDLSLAASSGSARLDAAALRAVRHWRWRPTLQDGVPVRVRGVVTIPFILTG